MTRIALAGAALLAAIISQAPATAAPMSHSALAAPGEEFGLAQEVRHRGWRHRPRYSRRPYLRPYAWRYGRPYAYRRYGYVRPYAWRSPYYYPYSYPPPFLAFGFPFFGGPFWW